MTTSVKRTASEGDLVWIHQHVRRTPEDLGRAVINIFRMKDGKFAEHWNLGQAVPETSKNDNTIFKMTFNMKYQRLPTINLMVTRKYLANVLKWIMPFTDLAYLCVQRCYI